MVRRALDGETMTTLDDVERTFDSDMVIICDDDGPTSIAGIMGGERSEVRETTTRVLMEAATWNGPNIQRTSTRLALRSEASGRFEKQLQPEQAMDGQALAAILMTELSRRAAGRRARSTSAGPGRRRRRSGCATSGPSGCSAPRSRATRRPDPAPARVRGRRGARRARRHRARASGAATSRARPTSSRRSRACGGSRSCPYTLPSRRGATGVLAPEQRLRRRAEDALAGAGLSEVCGWVFAAPDLVDRLRIPDDDWRRNVVPLRNPMSEDMSVLRTTLLGSLLDVARRNRARGMGDVRLYEIGAVFLAQPRSGERTAAEERSEPLPEERDHIGALLTGALRPPSWRESEPPRADFFAAKAVLGGAARRAARAVDASSGPREPFLHPGRAARVLVGGGHAGWLGEIHPSVARAWDLDDAAGFELDLGVIEHAALYVPRYEDLTSFPAVLPGPRVVVRARRAGRRRDRDRARGRRRAAARAPRCSTSTPPRTASRWPCGSSSAPTTGR